MQSEFRGIAATISLTVVAADPGKALAVAPIALRRRSHAVARSPSRSPTKMLVNAAPFSRAKYARTAPPGRLNDSPLTWRRPGPAKGSMKMRFGHLLQAKRLASKY